MMKYLILMSFIFLSCTTQEDIPAKRNIYYIVVENETDITSMIKETLSEEKVRTTTIGYGDTDMIRKFYTTKDAKRIVNILKGNKNLTNLSTMH